MRTGAFRTSTILIVDDMAMMRRLFAGALQAMGYDVVTSADGPSALKQIDRLPYLGLLITDVVMPGMNGRTLAQRAREIRPGLPILLSTSFNMSIRENLRVFSWPVLYKPFGKSELQTKVTGLLAAAA